MKRTSWLVAAGIFLLKKATAWDHTDDSSLRKALESNKYTLVAFVMPSHDDSVALGTEWLKATEREQDDNIVSIDCSEHAKICRELDVVSFPTIRLFHYDGRIDRYRGPRKARDIAMFLRRSQRPTITEADKNTMGPLTLLDDVVIMAHPHPDDQTLTSRFKTFAEQYRDRFSFVMTPPIQRGSAMTCYNNIDDVKHEASDVSSVQAIENFINTCSEPLIPEITRRNEGKYTLTGKSILHYFAFTDAEKETYRDQVRDLAKKYDEFLHFTITDSTEYSDMLPAYGLKAGSKTGMVLENPNTGDLYPYTGRKKISAQVIEGFLEEITTGRLTPKGNTRAGGGKGGGHDEL